MVICPNAHCLHHHQLPGGKLASGGGRGSRCEKHIRPRRPAAGQPREVTGYGQTSHHVLPSQIRGRSILSEDFPFQTVQLAPSQTTTSKYS